MLGATFDDASEALQAVSTYIGIQEPRTRCGTALWFARRLAELPEPYYPLVWGGCEWASTGSSVPVALRDTQAVLWSAVDEVVRCRNKGAGGNGHCGRPRLFVRATLLRSAAAVLLHRATFVRIMPKNEVHRALFLITPEAVQDLFGATMVHVVRNTAGLIQPVVGGPPFAVRGASAHLRWCFTVKGELGHALFDFNQQVLCLKSFPILYVRS